jgi:hypothetical protein
MGGYGADGTSEDDILGSAVQWKLQWREGCTNHSPHSPLCNEIFVSAILLFQRIARELLLTVESSRATKSAARD